MRRVLTYVVVWGGATTLAMLLVWFAARPVLRGAVFGTPSARRPIAGERPSATPRPTTPPPGDASTVATASPSPSATPATRDRTYVTPGGRVVLSLTPAAARLVSATPSPGYEVSIWRGDAWLRVDFTRGQRVSSLFATWNGHEPTVQVQGAYG
ncbi:MAG: hypothetical protein ACRDP6_05580 [Actinoallomurus sp.]